MAESAEQKRRYVDPATGEPKDSSSGSATGAGPKAEKEKQGDGGKQRDAGKHGKNQPTTDTVDKPDRKGQGNLGGRNPGQPQTSSGDQDSSENRPDMGIVDPMTSRMPGKERKNDHDR
jgi:hypothetical protein